MVSETKDENRNGTASRFRGGFSPSWIAALMLTAGMTIFLGLIWLANVFDALEKLGKKNALDDFFKSILSMSRWNDLAANFVVVDYSTVNTLLLLIVCVCVLLKVWKAGHAWDWKRFPRDPSQHLPFWPSYKTVFVNLGLVGTVFGFIVAFHQTKAMVNPAGGNRSALEGPVRADGKSAGQDGSLALDSESSISHNMDESRFLLDALGTSLYSTFTAILLAFVFCPFLFELPFYRFVLKSKGLPATSMPDAPEEAVMKLQEALEKLHGTTSRVNDAFSELLKKSSELGLDGIKAFMHTVGLQLAALNRESGLLNQGASKGQVEATAHYERFVKEVGRLHDRLESLENGRNADAHAFRSALVSFSRVLLNPEAEDSGPADGRAEDRRIRAVKNGNP
jgi:hypothetical protein